MAWCLDGCGGGTADHDVVRDKKVVAKFRTCTGCGKVEWLWNEPEWPRGRFQREAIVALDRKSLEH
jgi:hypothetical protein